MIDVDFQVFQMFSNHNLSAQKMSAKESTAMDTMTVLRDLDVTTMDCVQGFVL